MRSDSTAQSKSASPLSHGIGGGRWVVVVVMVVGGLSQFRRDRVGGGAEKYEGTV